MAPAINPITPPTIKPKSSEAWGSPPISNLVVIYSKSSFTLVALDFTFPLAC